jgi:hypothetical protein
MDSRRVEMDSAFHRIHRRPLPLHHLHHRHRHRRRRRRRRHRDRHYIKNSLWRQWVVKALLD